MEALLALFIPIALLWVGLSIITGRSISPDVVLRTITKLSFQTFRWLWKDRRKPGGAGRSKRPTIRYRR